MGRRLEERRDTKNIIAAISMKSFAISMKSGKNDDYDNDCEEDAQKVSLFIKLVVFFLV